MSETYESTASTGDHENHYEHNDHHEPGLYEICVKGHLDDSWTTWFGGLTVTLEQSGNTVLTGLVVDQAALHGLLRKVRDLGMPLLSVIRLQSSDAESSDVRQ
jgi:hypothetical protein